jgi:hypothetical protein
MFIVLVQAGLITVMYALDYGVGYMFAVTGIMEDVIKEVQIKRVRSTSPSASPTPNPNPPTGPTPPRTFKRFRPKP